MKCEVCLRPFLKERTFATLFKRHVLCPDCEKQYSLQPSECSIPTANHPLVVQTMFPCTNRDEHVEQSLLLVYPSLFRFPYPREYDIILFADSWLVMTKQLWVPLLSPLGSIYIYSLFWFSWED